MVLLGRSFSQSLFIQGIALLYVIIGGGVMVLDSGVLPVIAKNYQHQETDALRKSIVDESATNELPPLLPKQSTSQQQPRPLIAEEKTCYPHDQVSVRTYMYHYVRPEHRDAEGSVISNNSISPEEARDQFSTLHDLQTINEVNIIFLSDLLQYKQENCFPHTNNIILTFDDGRRDNYEYLLPLSEEFEIKVNLGIIVDRIGRDGNVIQPFMTYQQIKKMIDSGWFEIASHSRTHSNLKEQPYAHQWKEICESKYRLEEMFGIQIDSFIYPMGKYNDESLSIAKHCGYSFAWSTRPGSTKIGEILDYPYSLERIRVNKGQTGSDLFGRSN